MTEWDVSIIEDSIRESNTRTQLLLSTRLCYYTPKYIKPYFTILFKIVSLPVIQFLIFIETFSVEDSFVVTTKE